MIITTTAISFSSISVVLAFCGIRMLQEHMGNHDHWTKKEVGILLPVFLFNFALGNRQLAVGSLFFTGSPRIFYWLILISSIFLTITAILGVYIIFYLYFPLISPLPGMAFAFILGIPLVVFTFVNHPHPFIDSGGAIDLNFSRGTSVLLSYLLFISIGSTFLIFVPLFSKAKTHEVRSISLIMSCLAIIGIINVFIRYLLPNGITPDSLRNRLFDITLTILGLVFIAIFLLPPILVKWFSKIKN